jgi:hypothetical protein
MSRVDAALNIDEIKEFFGLISGHQMRRSRGG